MPTNNKKFLKKAKIQLTVDDELWHRVSSLNNSASDDKHYAVKMDEDGTLVIIFGDGRHGARPPSESNNIKVTYSPKKYFNGVLLQQVQVQLDNDWNEVNDSSSRFYGIYRGLVMDNTDPQSLMRLRVQIPAVLGIEEIWALPCTPVGTSVVPAVGKGVWVMFESGDPAIPVWMGTWSDT